MRLYLLEIEDINKEKLERQIVTVPKQRHFNPINLNLNRMLRGGTWPIQSIYISVGVAFGYIL
jgi:hypothetical protein